MSSVRAEEEGFRRVVADDVRRERRRFNSRAVYPRGYAFTPVKHRSRSEADEELSSPKMYLYYETRERDATRNLLRDDFGKLSTRRFMPRWLKDRARARGLRRLVINNLNGTSLTRREYTSARARARGHTRVCRFGY